MPPSFTHPEHKPSIEYQFLSFHGKFNIKWPFVYVLSYFFSGRLPLGMSESGGQRGAREPGGLWRWRDGCLREWKHAVRQWEKDPSFAVHSYRCL